MCLPSLDQESDFPMSLSPDLAPRISSPKGIADDVLVYADPPTTLNEVCKFDVGKQSNTVSELDISITLEVKLHDSDDSKDISQELCNEVTEPPILDFDDDILYAKYESFHVGLILLMVLMWVFILHINHSLLIPSFLTFYLI